MLLCKQDNRSAEMYVTVARSQVVCVATTTVCYTAMCEDAQCHLMAARISCEYMAADLTYFRLPSVAMPPSFVNLIANFVQSWTWSLLPFNARPVS